MSRRIHASLVVSVALLATSAIFGAERVPPTAPREEPSFHLDLNLDAWFPRLVGDVHVGGSSSVNVDDLGLHDSQVQFSGTARLSWDRWLVDVTGWTTEVDSDPTVLGMPASGGPFSGGFDTVTSEYSWWSVGATVGYALWTPFADATWPWSTPEIKTDLENWNSESEYMIDLRIAPLLGVTWDQIRLNVNDLTTGLAAETDGGWASVRFGVGLDIWLRPGADFPFLHAIVFGVAVSGGPAFGVSGDAQDVGGVIVIDGGARLLVTPNIGAHLGYRYVRGSYGAEGGDLDVSLQGLIAGVAIRF